MVLALGDVKELELVLLYGSAFSRRVKWAMAILQVPYKVTPYTPFVGELQLRWRLFRWKALTTEKKVTVPVAFIKVKSKKEGGEETEIVLDDSHKIVKWADQVKGRKNPELKLMIRDSPIQMDSILTYCKQADELQEFRRYQLMQQAVKTPEMLLPLLPALLKEKLPKFLAVFLCKLAAQYMAYKYQNPLCKDVKRIHAILQHLRAQVIGKQKALEQPKAMKMLNQFKDTMTETLTQQSIEKQDQVLYLVGTEVSCADLFLVIAIDGYASIVDKSKKASGAALVDIAKAYPEVYQYADLIWKHHGFEGLEASGN